MIPSDCRISCRSKSCATAMRKRCRKVLVERRSKRFCHTAASSCVNKRYRLWCCATLRFAQRIDWRLMSTICWLDFPRAGAQIQHFINQNLSNDGSKSTLRIPDRSAFSSRCEQSALLSLGPLDAIDLADDERGASVKPDHPHRGKAIGSRSERTSCCTRSDEADSARFIWRGKSHSSVCGNQKADDGTVQGPDAP